MPNFNIDSFLAAYSDFAKGYTFYCKLDNVPGGVNLLPDHHFLVKSTTLPQNTLGEAETDWQGNKAKIATTQEYEDFEITFKSDVRADLRNQLLRWNGLIHNPVTNAHGSPSQSGGYLGTVILEHLNQQGEVITTYQLVGAWPKVVGTVTLDYASKEMVEFSVTFTYLYHLISDADGNPIYDGSDDVAGTGLANQ